MSTGLYRFDFYDKNGKLKRSMVEKLPTSPSRWKQSKEMERKAGIKTRDYTKETRGGVNKKVIKSFATFPNGERQVVTLLTKDPKSKVPKKQLRAIRRNYAIQSKKNKK